MYQSVYELSLILFSLISFENSSLLLLQIQVEKTVRNGYKTTKLQLNISLKECTDRIEKLVQPFEKLLMLNAPTELLESHDISKALTLIRQCERFLHDLLNTLANHQMYIERYLKNFRIQLNKIHEIVKFRTAIPINNIFVSGIFMYLCIYIKYQHYKHCVFSWISTKNKQAKRWRVMPPNIPTATVW